MESAMLQRFLLESLVMRPGEENASRVAGGPHTGRDCRPVLTRDPGGFGLRGWHVPLCALGAVRCLGGRGGVAAAETEGLCHYPSQADSAHKGHNLSRV